MKHICFVSSGVASFMSAYLVCEKFKDDKKHLIFADTLFEDEDNYRFLKESNDYLVNNYKNVFCHYLKDGRNPWDIVTEQNFISHRAVQCSVVLKAQICKTKVLELAKTDDVTLYLGIDFNEVERTEKIIKNWKPFNVDFPLLWDNWTSKKDCFDFLEKIKINPPRLYKYGFAHANCGGFCFKTGKGQLLKLLEYFPERYAEMEKREQEFIAKNGKPRIIRESKNGKLTTISLKELRERSQQQLEIDFDLPVGGCGCFIN